MGQAPKRLSKEQSELMREAHANGESIASVSKRFGVSKHTASVHCNKASQVPDNPLGPPIEDRAQPYRDNLSWAMSAAGHFLRTKERPIICPNNACWFLYCQAIDEPKDFMAKVNQIESKADGGELERESKSSSRRSLAEIDLFLQNLGESNGKEEESCEEIRGSDIVRQSVVQEAAG